MKRILGFLLLLVTGYCPAQNSFPATGTTVLDAGTDRTLTLKDGRSGTNWNYLEWQFSDGSRDWVLGRRQGTGFFTLWRHGVSEVFTVDNSGNVGIGTTAPAAPLHVGAGTGALHYGNQGVLIKPATGNRALMELHSPDGQNRLVLQSLGTTSYLSSLDNKPLVLGGNVGLGTVTPSTLLSFGQLINPRLLSLWDEPSNWYGLGLQGGQMRLQVGSAGARFSFFAGENAELLTIKGDGNVGVGTTAPASKLQVVGGGSGTIDLVVNGRLQTGDAGNSGGIFLSNASNMFVGQAGTNVGFWTAGVGWNAFQITQAGNVGIGTTSPDAKLSVKGQVHAQEVKVDLNGAVAPDYVFNKDYKLPSLEEIKSYIEKNSHLPEVPSAKEMEANGMNLGEMNLMLLKKVEELTLYVIELKNENQEIRKEFGERIETISKQR